MELARYASVARKWLHFFKRRLYPRLLDTALSDDLRKLAPHQRSWSGIHVYGFASSLLRTHAQNACILNMSLHNVEKLSGYQQTLDHLSDSATIHCDCRL